MSGDLVNLRVKEEDHDVFIGVVEASTGRRLLRWDDEHFCRLIKQFMREDYYGKWRFLPKNPRRIEKQTARFERAFSVFLTSILGEVRAAQRVGQQQRIVKG